MFPSTTCVWRMYYSRKAFSKAEAHEIVDIMKNNQLFVNLRLVTDGCSKVPSISQWGKFEDKKYIIKELCHLIQNVVQNNYHTEVATLEDALTNDITNSIMSMISRELLSPISSYIAQWERKRSLRRWRKQDVLRLKKCSKRTTQPSRN
jgi:hypothetical protein